MLLHCNQYTNPKGVKHESPGCEPWDKEKQNGSVLKGRNTVRIKGNVLGNFSADFSTTQNLYEILTLQEYLVSGLGSR